MMRYEIKYRLETYNYAFVRRIVESHPASFRISYPDRKIHNIYYDTPKLNCFYQNLNGDPMRKKARVRWYGEKENPSKLTLEIKNKAFSLGWKDHEKVLDSNDPVQLPKHLLDRMHYTTPTLYNSYLRTYFETPDRKFRITIDREQRFDSPFFYNKRIQYPINNSLIVELKYDKDVEDEARFIMQNIPFRQSKNSKYTEGVIFIIDPL